MPQYQLLNLPISQRERGVGAAPKRRTDRRGAILPLAAFFMIMVIGMVAFALDFGRMMVARTQLQCAADAAAIAGALTLSGGTAAAQTTAVNCGQTNTAMGSAVIISGSQDVVLGNWNKSTLTFTASSGTQTSNAVKVTCVLSHSRSNALAMTFGQIFNVASADVSATAIATCVPNNPCAFTGLNGITISGGSYTDSYDSSTASYTAGSAGNLGSVCSNGAIGLSGGSTVVNGDADTGPSGSFSASGGSHITGSQNTLAQNITEAAVNVGSAATVNNNASIPLTGKGNQALSGGAFSLNGGDSLSLPPGTYYFSSATISGGSTLTITGQTIIYVTGNINFSGASLTNTTSLATNLQIYDMGTTVVLSGATQTYATIYAPTADITRSGGGSDFFGSMVGKSLTLSGGGGLHYDTSLGGGGSSTVQLVQ